MKILLIMLSWFTMQDACNKTSKSGTSGSNADQTRTTQSSVDEIIFGRYCGRCISGKCSPMYKIDFKNSTLSLDNSSNYNQRLPLNFSKELPVEQYKVASDLRSGIPDSLFLSTEKRFGCPDCADQCGLYLEINKGGKKYDYELDNKSSNMSGFIVDYATRLQDVINKLQEQNK